MKRIIAILLISVGLLVLLGAMMLYSSTTLHQSLHRLVLFSYWLGVALAAGMLAAFLKYPLLQRRRLPLWLLIFSALSLVCVFLPGVGVDHNGAHRWLFLGQPSEFAKLALILFLADYITRNQERMAGRNVGFLVPGAIAGLVCLLIFLEPDWGTTALMSLVLISMLAIAGSHWFYLASVTVIGAEAFFLLLLPNEVRMKRILAFLDPEKYKDTIGWQAWHSLLSLGNGGLFGAFFGNGQHKNGFVPELQTDFVLALVGEELGLLGTLLVIGLFVCILLCGARIACATKDPFGRFLAAGLTILISAQAFINIGVVTSVLPNKGIALPFVSYGGSNLVAMSIAVGLLVNIARQSLPASAPRKTANPFIPPHPAVA